MVLDTALEYDSYQRKLNNRGHAYKVARRIWTIWMGKLANEEPISET